MLQYRRAKTAAVTAVTCLLAAACGSTSAAGSASSTSTTQGSKVASLAAEVPASVKAQGYLVFASGATIKPLYFLDQAGKIHGEETAQAAAVAKELGLPVRFENIPFAGIIPAMAANRVDLTELTDTQAREATVDFIDFSKTYFTFVVNSGNPKNISTPMSLCGDTVAQTQGTPEIKAEEGWSTACTQSGKPAINIVQFNDAQSSLLAVESGRAEAFLLDSTSAKQAVSQVSGLTTSGHVLDTYAGFAVLKSRPHLEKAILDALTIAMKNGTIQAIARKYQEEYGTPTTLLSTPIVNAASNGTSTQ